MSEAAELNDYVGDPLTASDQDKTQEAFFSIIRADPKEGKVGGTTPPCTS